MRQRIRSCALACSLVLAGASGCPSQVEHGAPGSGVARVDPNEPNAERLVQVGGDLYVKDAASNPIESEEPTAPGSGAPDETNGECRLFAPKLPEPECCKFETGFDAEDARSICGHTVYLGESVRMSCGYFFSDETLLEHPSFRASLINFDDPKTAAQSEAEQLNFQLRRTDIKPEAIKEIKGAYILRNKHFRWAFLPGWSKVRKVSWIEASCADDKVNELLAVIAGAKPPPPGEQRPMIPVARQ